MKKHILYIILIIGLSLSANAQEPFFSQPYGSSQFLNTASVGNGVYDQRINGNVRTQFIDNNKAYQTVFVGWDFKDNRYRKNESHYMAYGVNILSDQMMGGAITTNHITANIAYHLYLDRYYTRKISLGLGATYTNTMVDRNKLIFGDQYNTFADLVNANSIELIRNNASKFSMNAGILFNKHNENEYLETGASVFFQSTPNLLSSTRETNMIPKTVLYANYETAIGESFSINFHGSYINKNSINQVLSGGSIGIPISNDEEKDKKLYLGCYYRFEDALIPSVKLLMNKYVMGLSYDIYNNNITQARIKQNSFELTFSAAFGNKRPGLIRTIFD
jgi:hypothetical protein